jgi:hypothetical protein
MLLSLALSLSLGGLIADAPRSAALLSPEERVTLQARYDELSASPAPSLAPPIVLLAAAVVSAGVGISFVLGAGFGALTVGGAFFTGLLIVGFAALVVAAGLAIPGGILLAAALRERRARSAQLRGLKEQLQRPEREGTPPPAPSVDTMQAPLPSVLLATF